jgi:hypothetical protein
MSNKKEPGVLSIAVCVLHINISPHMADMAECIEFGKDLLCVVAIFLHIICLFCICERALKKEI